MEEDKRHLIKISAPRMALEWKEEKVKFESFHSDGNYEKEKEFYVNLLFWLIEQSRPG